MKTGLIPLLSLSKVSIMYFYFFSAEEEEEDTSSEVILYGSLMCISLNKKFDSLTWATVVKHELQENSNKK